MDLGEEPERQAWELEACVAGFVGAMVFNVLFHAIPTILTFVGAWNPDWRTVWLGSIGVAAGLGFALLRPPREVLGWVFTLCGPWLLGVWFSLKKTSEPGAVTGLMGAALAGMAVVALLGLLRATWWKVVLAVVVGFGVGEVPAHWLRDRLGVEAAWLIGAGMISAASLVQSPRGLGRWRWVIGFLAAGVSAMLAGVQIHVGSMRLEYHFPARGTLLAPFGG
jgi:hypothetical protein